jgi:hypothetical protein
MIIVNGRTEVVAEVEEYYVRNCAKLFVRDQSDELL